MSDDIKPTPVEVYLPSTVFRGKILVRHKRLSDYLNSKLTGEIIRLNEVEVPKVRGKSFSVKAKTALISKRQVLFVVDLSSGRSATRDNEDLSLVNKEACRVLLELGSFWIQGDVHLVPGSDLNSFADGKSCFIPLTNATFSELEGSSPHTFLINRDKINCLMDLTEAVPFVQYPALATKRR